MNKTTFSLLALALAGASLAQTLNSTHSYQVETSGTYSADSKYFNVGAAGGGKYLSFGALDFDASSLNLSGMTVTGATLNMTDSTHNSVAGTFNLYAVTDSSTSLAAGQTAITYDANTIPGGYSGQLGVATLLATFTFTPATTAGGPLNYSISNGLGTLQTLLGASDHTLRLVITGDNTGYAGYAGAGTGSAGIPTLSLTTQAVPAPSALAGLSIGLIGLVALKRRK